MLNKYTYKLILLGFVAGFVSTIIFHQEVLEFLYQMHMLPKKPFSMAPTKPVGVPALISLSFWGGVWGIAGVLFFRKYLKQKRFWLFFTLFGGIFPPLIALCVVFPLKHINLHLILTPAGISFLILVNAIWGFGTAFIFKILSVHLEKKSTQPEHK